MGRPEGEKVIFLAWQDMMPKTRKGDSKKRNKKKKGGRGKEKINKRK